jgi:hypothetical protein
MITLVHQALKVHTRSFLAIAWFTESHLLVPSAENLDFDSTKLFSGRQQPCQAHRHGKRVDIYPHKGKETTSTLPNLEIHCELR